MQDIVIVGEVEAGEAAKVRKSLEKLVKQMEMNTFDLAELLHKVKAKHLYTTPTFEEYVDELNLPRQRARYLEQIVDCMEQVGIPRAEYEPVGVTKLRAIARLDPKSTYTNPATNEAHPMADYISGLVELAVSTKTEKLEEQVRVLRGETGENDQTWLNIRLQRLTLENVIKPAFDKAAINIGTVKTDTDGVAQDASDARKLEIICVNYLTDLQSDPEVQNA